MLFHSLQFLLFVPVIFAIYWAVADHKRVRQWLLLLGSFTFYMAWNPAPVVLILYLAGRAETIHIQVTFAQHGLVLPDEVDESVVVAQAAGRQGNHLGVEATLVGEEDTDVDALRRGITHSRWWPPWPAARR